MYSLDPHATVPLLLKGFQMSTQVARTLTASCFFSGASDDGNWVKTGFQPIKTGISIGIKQVGNTGIWCNLY